jgi:hypothetical protein
LPGINKLFYPFAPTFRFLCQKMEFVIFLVNVDKWDRQNYEISLNSVLSFSSSEEVQVHTQISLCSLKHYEASLQGNNYA